MISGNSFRPRFFYCPDCKRTSYIGPNGNRSCGFCNPSEMDEIEDDRPVKPELPDYPD